MPSMDQYAASDLPLQVAQLMGDQEGMEQFSRPKVMTIMPQSIAGRLIDTVKSMIPGRRKKDIEPPADGLGKSSQTIANERRRKGLFE